MNYQIKQIEENEIPKAIDLVLKIFLEFDEQAEQGIEEFKKFITIENINEKKLSQGLQLWGAYENNKIVGVIAFRKPLHISLLFVDKDYQRQGIARRLFQVLLDSSHENIVTVCSSPYAVEIYKKLGFVPVGDENVKNGLRQTRMEYKRKA